MRITHASRPRPIRTGSQFSRRVRMAIVTGVALIALMTAGAAIAQSSLAYDLACRSALDSGGGILTAPSANYGVVGAVGQSPAGEARSANYGVRGGYVQPDSPPVTAAVGARIAAGDQLFRTLLPLVRRTLRVVRGGC